MPAERYVARIEAQITALEQSILNFEYARERMMARAATADPAELPQYEQALAKNRATLLELSTRLGELREKFARAAGRNVHRRGLSLA